MSDYGSAYKKTMGIEGGVNFDPTDRGNVVASGVVTKPTYKGIAPVSNPKWPGWEYIDGCIKQLTTMPHYGTGSYYNWAKHLNKCLAEITTLQSMVREFYRVNYWGQIGRINDQRIAEATFDRAVNMGVKTAAKLLQRAAGVAVDGDIGKDTTNTVNGSDPASLLDAFNAIAKQYYEDIIERDPSQGQFRKSWFSRLRNYDDTPFVA